MPSFVIRCVASFICLTHPESLRAGMVKLPHGRMKSREGTVVDVDHLLDQVRDMCIAKHHSQLEPQEARHRAEAYLLIISQLLIYIIYCIYIIPLLRLRSLMRR